MKISVIIPCTNADYHLAKEAERSVLNSTYKNVEVLIVNTGKKRSAQRNEGIKQTDGQIVMYLDSDQTISPNLLTEAVTLIRDGYSSLYVPEKIVTKGWFGKLRNYERGFYDGSPVDCVRIVRRDCCPLFDENLDGPEDSLHDRQVKGLKGITRNCLYHNDGVGVISYFKKKAHYARSMSAYKRLSPNDKVTSFWWRCVGVYCESGKWKKIVRHPIMFLGVIVMIGIRGVIYLWNSR